VKLSTDHHRALAVLYSCPDGCTEALLLAQGFTRGLIAELILAGLARASMEQAAAGKRVTDVRRIRIMGNGLAAFLAPGATRRPAAPSSPRHR
jgi:hypothetical protein